MSAPTTPTAEDAGTQVRAGAAAASGAPTADAPTDGRAARAARTRQSIVDALLSLLEEGDLQPTANRIAERAGISLRLIYHHFGDLESLFRATAIRQAERMASIADPVDPALPLAERIDALAERRGRTLEWITPVRRAALLHEPFSVELRRARDAFAAAGDRQLVRLFQAELDAMAADEREEVLAAMAMATSWSAWDALRSAGRSVEEATAAVRRTLRALLGG